MTVVTIKERASRRHVRGTPEWIVDKWTRKLFFAYAHYSNLGDGMLPSFLRAEFMRDIAVVVEKRIQELFPEKSVIGCDSLMKDRQKYALSKRERFEDGEELHRLPIGRRRS